MKQLYKYIIPLVVFLAILSSCEDYLDFPVEASITQEEVFGSYQKYQGFLDQNYRYLVDWNRSKITVGQQLAGETIAVQGWNTSRAAAEGNYLGLVNGRSCYNDYGGGDDAVGWWTSGWNAIRVANQAISNIDLLVNATEEERNLLLGQAYFFRALFHMEIWRAFGSIPYIDEVLTDDINKPRFFEYNGQKNCQAVAERMVEDFDRAAQLLPLEWFESNRNYARVTKGAALAYKARVLLTAGSPLFNEFSGGPTTFDKGFMERAAEAAGEVLKLADQGVYGLTPFEQYKDMFCKNDGTLPVTKELIFHKVRNQFGSTLIENVGLGRLFLPHQGIFGGNAITEAVTQNYVDKYEMADGTKYLTEYDTDNSKRWNGRDPRFRGTIYVDGDRAGFSDRTVLQMYIGGRTLNNGNTLSPYIVHKFWSVGANREDAQWNQFYYHTPLMRLADVYLMYSEAVYEAYGDASASASNYGMTAVQAVNMVRQRAGMPAATSSPTTYDGDFRELVRNERAVELSFEGHYWFDLRRWKVKPDPILFRMTFDRNYTFFNREQIIPFVFDDRHWWLPFPRALTFSVEGFPQNPGWE